MRRAASLVLTASQQSRRDSLVLEESVFYSGQGFGRLWRIGRHK
jgi:hypothetical protein